MRRDQHAEVDRLVVAAKRRRANLERRRFATLLADWMTPTTAFSKAV